MGAAAPAQLDGPGEARLAEVSRARAGSSSSPSTSDRAAGRAAGGRARLGVRGRRRPGPVRAELDGVSKTLPVGTR